MMVLLWLLLHLWLSVVFLTYPLLMPGLELLPFCGWDNLILTRLQQPPAYIPGAFSKLTGVHKNRDLQPSCMTQTTFLEQKSHLTIVIKHGG